MGRPAAWTDGEKITHTRLNQFRTDMFSLTDTNAQTVVGDVTFSGNVTLGNVGIASGYSPITIPHGLTGATTANTAVIPAPLATQTYPLSYNVDATNVYIYHDKVGSLTVSYWIFKFG